MTNTVETDFSAMDLHMVIFAPYCTSFYFDDEMEENLYKVTDTIHKDCEMLEQDVLFNIIYENIEHALKLKKPVILMEYSPSVALCLKTVIDKVRTGGAYAVDVKYLVRLVLEMH